MRVVASCNPIGRQRKSFPRGSPHAGWYEQRGVSFAASRRSVATAIQSCQSRRNRRKFSIDRRAGRTTPAWAEQGEDADMNARFFPFALALAATFTASNISYADDDATDVSRAKQGLAISPIPPDRL